VLVRFPERRPDEDQAALIEVLERATRLGHINLAQTLDVGRLEGHLYIVSEFVDGLELSAILDHAVDTGQPLPTDVAAFIIAELCAGLAYAHGRRDERGQPMNLVHGDLQPAHVMVSRSGEVKALDLGLALWRRQHGPRDPEARVWQPPELREGAGAPDLRADLWATGAMARALITGQHPSHASAALPLVSVVPDLPPEIAQVIERCLHPEPAHRPKSATEVRTALSNWLRTGSPGFGRHRLKAWMQREMAAAYAATRLDGTLQPLHRKDWVFADTGTALSHAVQPGWDTPRPTADTLLRVTSPDVEPRPPKAAREARPAPPRPAGPTAGGRSPATPPPPPPRGAGPAETHAGPTPLDPPEGDAIFARSDWNADSPADAPAPAPTASSRLDPPAPAPPATSAAEPGAEAPPAPRDEDYTRAVSDEDDLDLGPVHRPRRESTWGPWALLALLGAGGVGAWMALTGMAQGQGLRDPLPQDASAFITSRPQGAVILVDGQPLDRTTPAPLPRLPLGTEVEVTVQLEGYQSPAPTTLTLAARPEPTLRLELTPLPHTVRIDSEPPGATIIHQGVAVGLTPYVLGPVQVDYREGLDVVLRMDGYLDDQVAILWSPGQSESSVRRTLMPDPAWTPPEEVAEEAPSPGRR
jgi:serine/threonine-protein kinase